MSTPTTESARSTRARSCSIGDRVTVTRSGHAQDAYDQTGEIEAVLPSNGAWFYRVRWNDGSSSVIHESALASLEIP